MKKATTITILLSASLTLAGCAGKLSTDERCAKLSQAIDGMTLALPLLESQCAADACDQVASAAQAALAATRAIYQGECTSGGQSAVK